MLRGVEVIVECNYICHVALMFAHTNRQNFKTGKDTKKLSPVHVLLGKSFCRFDYYHLSLYIFIYVIFSYSEDASAQYILIGRLLLE